MIKIKFNLLQILTMPSLNVKHQGRSSNQCTIHLPAYTRLGELKRAIFQKHTNYNLTVWKIQTLILKVKMIWKRKWMTLSYQGGEVHYVLKEKRNNTWWKPRNTSAPKVYLNWMIFRCYIYKYIYLIFNVVLRFLNLRYRVSCTWDSIYIYIYIHIYIYIYIYIHIHIYILYIFIYIIYIYIYISTLESRIIGGVGIIGGWTL